MIDYTFQLDQLLTAMTMMVNAQYVQIVLICCGLFYLVFFHGKGRF